MSFDWQQISIGDCIEKVVDNRGKTPPISESKTAFRLIEINAIVGANKHPDYSAVRKYVDQTTYQSWFRSGHPQIGDVLFSTVGSIAEVAIFNGGNGCIAQNLIGLRPNKKLIESHFLYYVLADPATNFRLKTLDISSVQPSIKVPHLLATKIAVPNLKTQVEISSVLSSLDSRITLLRETNATLEAIAQALFKSWFVDFDPVRAKMEGRAPEGMDEETAALFPDSFEESELGLVPRGWGIQSLDEIATFLNGLALQKFPPKINENWLPVIKIAQLRKGDTIGADKAGCNIKPEYIIQNGDVLFSWSGSLEVEIWCGGVGALNQHLFKVSSADFPKWFYFFWTRQHLPNFRRIAESKATTMGHIQRKHLTEAKVFVPTEAVMNAARNIFEPLLMQFINNALQAQTLSSLRDTLLPRLISGQLRVGEV